MRAPMVPRASKAMPGGSIGQAAMVEIPSWPGRIPLCGKQTNGQREECSSRCPCDPLWIIGPAAYFLAARCPHCREFEMPPCPCGTPPGNCHPAWRPSSVHYLRWTLVLQRARDSFRRWPPARSRLRDHRERRWRERFPLLQVPDRSISCVRSRS